MKKILLVAGFLCVTACQKEKGEVFPVQLSKTEVSLDANRSRVQLFRGFKAVQAGLDGVLTKEARGFSSVEVERDAVALLAKERERFRAYLISEGFTPSECDEVEQSSPTALAMLSMATLAYSEEAKLYASTERLRSIDEPSVTTSEIFDCLLEATLGFGGISDLAKTGLGKYAVRKALVKMVGAAAAKAGLGPVGVAITVGIFVNCIVKASTTLDMVAPELSSSTWDSVTTTTPYPPSGTTEVTPPLTTTPPPPPYEGMVALP